MPDTQNKATIVIGHKNPDTDSVCSAICYARLKGATAKDGGSYLPARAGHLNEETQFVLKYFGVEAPALVDSVKTQVGDIEIRKSPGVSKWISLKKAWNFMQENNTTTLAAVTEDGMLEGLITVGDITKSYMNVLDSSILSQANTRYSNIVDTLEGAMMVGDETRYFDQGKVLIAAANPDMMEYYISPHDLVILGNRYESQLCAIEMEADCIIVCEGAAPSLTIKKLATERGCTVMTTPYDAYTAARLINQSMPINHFMKTQNLITFECDDRIEDIKDIMASRRFRDFPIIDKDGKYMGMISRRNLLGATGKQVILVDHNERDQAVDGIEGADVREIIDHHRLGTIQTIAPVFFRCQPLGCTATIVYQMYKETKTPIEKDTAGLLCSAIISDTLLFRSPTCTPADEKAARDLAKTAGIGIEGYAGEMFAAGSNLKGKSDEEIFYQDFKEFYAGKVHFGVGQISSLNAGELRSLKARMTPYVEDARERHGMDMMFFMLTDILTESTDLLCAGAGARQAALEAFGKGWEGGQSPEGGAIRLEGVVSRKKQLIPALTMSIVG
ncbi:MAG: putative manganese-dependent inorganic diphosphatase [Lachnospiraceae bacterium]|jgi:manganese-dependent inorganic pyrophosphatase|nr:putative manganese-dependent inorganic diphosphatase [Lachnospiraceae bacterium]